jgi:mono/diheme cytochrome c family protein
VPEAGGVDLQPDVERIHRTVSREPHDPIEGRERPPWFLLAAIAIALFWGGWYLGRYGGEFDTTSHIAFAARQTGIAAASAEQSAAAVSDPVEAGRAVYEKNCTSCHQANGQGLPGVFPPLVGSEWVTGEPETVVRILLLGLQGPVQVAGTTYNGAMPAWADVLRDEEIAAVATYIRQLDANDAPAVPVAMVTALREVEAARTTPWTADELKRATAAGAPSAKAGGRAAPPPAPRGPPP